MRRAITLLVLISMAVYAQQKGTFTDPRDGKVYKTVKIGKQIWMAENLNYEHTLGECYEYKEANCKKYGKLYSRGFSVCPDGWDIPYDYEWKELADFVGGVNVAGKKLKTRNDWTKVANIRNTDDYGFSVLPAGIISSEKEGRYETIIEHGGLGNVTYFWTEFNVNKPEFYTYVKTSEFMKELYAREGKEAPEKDRNDIKSYKSAFGIVDGDSGFDFFSYDFAKNQVAIAFRAGTNIMEFHPYMNSHGYNEAVSIRCIKKEKEEEKGKLIIYELTED